LKFSEYISHMGHMRGAFKVLVGEQFGSLVSRYRHREKDNIKTDLKIIG
jgi:hypothetical protein